MNSTYIQLQREAQDTMQESRRRKRTVADFLDRMAVRCNREHGFPSDHIWFEEPIIIPPDADAREIQIEKDKPKNRGPRAVMVIRRDPYDGSQKINMGFRITTDTDSVEASLPLTVRVEESTLHITLPKPSKTEVKIQTDDLSERVKQQEVQLLDGVLRELHNIMPKFLTGATKESIGFHQTSGESL